MIKEDVRHVLSLSFFWSRSVLMNRGFLWLLFWCNLLGTVYGYIWYDDQLLFTLQNYPAALLVFVPDSPTASLFFTLSLLFLLYPPSRRSLKNAGYVIQGLAVVTSIKYGVWAASMIVAGWSFGGDMIWQDFMLIASHLAMAVEALLYVRFFGFGMVSLMIAAGWTLLNDVMDYTFGIYPYLPYELQDYVGGVRTFTFTLTILSFIAGWIALKKAKRL